MSIDAEKYPALAKMAEVKDRSQVIGEFIEWLGGEGIELGRWTQSGNYCLPISDSIEQLLAKYFEIDLVAVENERRAILDEVRKGNGATA